MINEQNDEHESEENINHGGSTINQDSTNDSLPNNLIFTSINDQPQSDSGSKKAFIVDSNVSQNPRNILDPFVINSGVKEIREIVKTVENAVFFIIDNNFDQLANRSSNTLGMRVKDSLILKVQQTYRKEIPFDALKTSLVCQMIVDDDPQIKFLPRIDSPAPSSDSENSSTKQKKSVSLAEEVKIFNRVENSDFFAENEIDLANELMDTHNDSNTDNENTAKSDENTYDFTSQKGSTSPVGSESFFLNNYNQTKTMEKGASFIVSDAVVSADKTEGNIVQHLCERSLINIETNSQDQIIELHEMTSNDLRKSELKIKDEETIEVSNKDSNTSNANKPEDRYEKVQTELIEQRRDVISKRSETVNVDSDKDSADAEKQREHLGLTDDINQQSESSLHLISSCFHESLKTNHLENIEAADLTVSESVKNSQNFEDSKETDNLKSCDINVTSNAYLHLDSSDSENVRDDFNNDETENEFFPCKPSTSITSYVDNLLASIVAIGTESPKLNPSPPALESNEEDDISEKGILNANFSAEKLQIFENILTFEATNNFKRSPEVVQKINECAEISEEQERRESSSTIKHEDEDANAGNENVKPLKDNSDKGIYKLCRKTFAAANVETGNIVKHPITSLVQKNVNKNEIVKDVTMSRDTNSNDKGNTAQQIHLEDAVEESDTIEKNEDESKNTGKLQKIKSQKLEELKLGDEEQNTKSTFDTKTNSPTNDLPSGKTLQKVSLKANKLLKQSSRTDSSADQRSTDDLSSKQTLSKHSRKAGKSSKKLSRTNINDIISLGPNNPAEEENFPNKTDTLAVAEISATENELSLIEKLRTNSTENFTAIDVSRNSYSVIEPMERKKSMLNVASKSSLKENAGIKDNLHPENDRDVTQNKRSKSFLIFKTGKSGNKSESTLAPVQLYPASVNTNGEKSDHPLEPSVNVKKLNSFLESLKRSLKSERNRSNRSQRTRESKSKVSSVSQTDMDEELAPESFTDLTDLDDIKKLARSTQSFDTEFSQSSAMIKKDFLIGGKEELETVSLENDEDSHLKQKSKSFEGFFKRSTAKSSKIGEIVDPNPENLIKKSMSEISKQLAEEIPKNVVQLYSVGIDSDSKQNNSSPRKIIDSSSRLDHVSQDLKGQYSCDVNESDPKSIPNELDLVRKFSKDLEANPMSVEKDDFSLKIDKSFAKLRKKISLKKSGKETLKKCLNHDEFRESKDFTNNSNREEKCSERSTGSVQKESRKETKNMDRDAVNNEKHIFDKSEPIGLEPITQTPLADFFDKSESVVIAYLTKPSFQDQAEEQTIVRNKMQSYSSQIENERSREQIDDLVMQDNEKHSLLSNIKAIFKSANKLQSKKQLNPSIEYPENINEKKSFHLLRTNKLGGQESTIEFDKEQRVHIMKESIEIATIQSTKSLQDNKKRTKSRRRSGHKLFHDDDAPFGIENLIQESHQATTQNNFMQEQNEDKTEDFGAGGKANYSEECIAESNLQMLLKDEKETDEKTAKISVSRTKSKTKQKDDVNGKKFALSLSRIFSNSSKKRNVTKKPKATADSQTNPEDFFEITKIPLSSSDDSNTHENDYRIRREKSDMTEDNREELVAIKSLDSMHDADSYPVVAKRSSKVSDLKCTAKISNDQLLSPEQSGRFIFAAPVDVNQISSENELATKHSLKDVHEIRNPSETIYVAKGTVVSYAPMVESAKYISNESDDRSNEDAEPEKRPKRSSGKSFAMILKLFSKASMKSKLDHETTEHHPVDQVGHEGNPDALRSGKYSIIKHREHRDNFVDQLNDETNGEYIISEKMNPEQSKKDNEDEDGEPESHRTIKKQFSKSKMKIRQPGIADNIENLTTHHEVLLVNNLDISLNKNRTKDRERDSTPAVIKSNEFNIVVNKVIANHDGLKPTEVVERVVVDEITVPPVSQMGLNDTINVEQKESRRSSDTKKDSLLSTVKSYISRRIDIEKEEREAVKVRADEKSRDESREDSITLVIEDSKKTSKEQSVPKTQSVFARGMKRLFKKRSSEVSSVVLNNNVEDPADELRQSLNIKTHSILLANDSNDNMIETESRDRTRKHKTNEKFDDKQFTVYNSAEFDTKYPIYYEESSKKLEDKIVQPYFDDLEKSRYKSTVSLQSNKLSSMTSKDNNIESPESLTFLERHTAISFPAQDKKQNENDAQNQHRSKIASKDFRRNPSFASRRSTVVMMATPDPPRTEPQSDVSTSSNQRRDGSSSSPTAFYYLLGPSLDEALIDVRVVFQNLIDKITGRSR